MAMAALATLVGCRTMAPRGASSPLTPTSAWEVWHDLSTLADLTPGLRSHMISSYCREGCRYDRHSAESSRFLRHDGDEGVLFEATGPGAITRIWMTSGEGTSQRLDPKATLRIYVDGASKPVFKGPLPSLFEGSRSPFRPPLARDRRTSSGGNVSYVPIAYRAGCRITLSGGDTTNLWFQFNHYSVDSAEGIVSFTGEENLSAWKRLLRRTGKSPWPKRPHLPPETHRKNLQPGENLVVDLVGPNEIRELHLDLPPSAWPGTTLVVAIDEHQSVRMSVADFFGQGRQGDAAMRSLLIGRDKSGGLYSYFPMPFWRRARVTLLNDGSQPVPVELGFRTSGQEPRPKAGRFGAILKTTDGRQPGEEHSLLDLSGAGKWVGLVGEFSAKGTRQYLEGDERIYIDDDSEVSIHGTGVEDFFNAGFYFDHGPLGLPLHGAPLDEPDRRSPRTVAYRLMLTDAIVFQTSIRARMEAGPTGDVAMKARTVAYFYTEF
ncbi:MAG: DUF2961 domain-containing protein [Thermoanaerobaculia bacterium]|nr:DUF2961 domain-containing protein [Thermoanaerobaculia bacterium]